ncbi:kinase-like domain-containing protein [Rhizophagus irregularis DAOM 181602=DAOM 197198]|nr:kinase-like domain-containing protein [Rhizophagus irregularis DAOM 181602=DAOM 197198]
MSNNNNINKIQSKENTNEYINWIKEALSKEYFKYYEFENFKNIQEIGSGEFGKVYRANWKNLEHYLTLKSFFNPNNITIKEIVNELKFQRDVNFHVNIIRYYGITKLESDYWLVMEYADGGTLRDYLKNNFNRLTWKHKYNLAYQLACSVSFLHDKGIVYRDLHSCNVLVHQNSIKLSDFGLSKRIDEASYSQSKLLGMVPYIDPKILLFNSLKLNEKSDVYSIGVLLWEISSGIPPFHEESNMLNLTYEILRGRREEIIPNTPNDYSNLYIECWNDKPNNRPSMHKVVDRLEKFISTENSLHGKVSQIIENFNNTNINEIDTIITNNDNDISSENSSIIVNEIDHLLAQCYVGGCYQFGHGITKHVKLAFQYYEKLANKEYAIGQFKLGWFYENKLSVNKDLKLAAYWYEKAANNGNLIAMFNLGYLHKDGNGVNKNDQKAFELFKKSAEGEYSGGISMLGYCYDIGIGINIDKRKAAELYQEAANLGNEIAQYNLALMYEKGNGIEKDLDKAKYWYKKSANQGDKDAKKKLKTLKTLKI